jgi:hypothetical protein
MSIYAGIYEGFSLLEYDKECTSHMYFNGSGSPFAVGVKVNKN